MKTKCKTYIKNADKDITVEYDAIEKCPKCNKAISPEKLYTIIIDKEENFMFRIFAVHVSR